MLTKQTPGSVISAAQLGRCLVSRADPVSAVPAFQRFSPDPGHQVTVVVDLSILRGIDDLHLLLDTLPVVYPLVREINF